MRKRKRKKKRAKGHDEEADGGTFVDDQRAQGRSDRELQEFLRQAKHSCTAVSYSIANTVLPDGYFHTLCSLLAKNITLEELDLSNVLLKP